VPAPDERLRDEQICWLATVRPDGRAHLSPIWFVWLDGAFWVCCTSSAVKARNVRHRPEVAVSLQSGTEPVVAEGIATLYARPFPADVVAVFRTKFDWDINGADEDGDYDTVMRIAPTKWVMGAPARSSRD
jgi:PPOX class probable F420-dependent enzyme